MNRVRHNRHLTSPGEQWSVEIGDTTLSYHGTRRDAQAALESYQATRRTRERALTAEERELLRAPIGERPHPGIPLSADPVERENEIDDLATEEVKTR